MAQSPQRSVGRRKGQRILVTGSAFPACEAWQISATGTKDFVTPAGIRVCPAVRLLDQLI